MQGPPSGGSERAAGFLGRSESKGLSLIAYQNKGARIGISCTYMLYPIILVSFG
jgi:hypothetical protein